MYVARITGSYFVMPKWGKGLRPGKTTMDIYRLFSREELAEMDVETVREKTDEALLFDAYREQETLRAKYGKKGIDGLENVLYACPHCRSEFSIRVKDGNTLLCDRCSYEQVSDEFGFLHNRAGIGKELRYVSDWSRRIYEDLRETVRLGQLTELTARVKILMVNEGKSRFLPAGEGDLRLTKDGFRIQGVIRNKETDLKVSIANVPTLPFSPGRYFEVQHGSLIYRCVPEDPRTVMKFINLVKIFHDLRMSSSAEPEPAVR